MLEWIRGRDIYSIGNPNTGKQCDFIPAFLRMEDPYAIISGIFLLSIGNQLFKKFSCAISALAGSYCLTNKKKQCIGNGDRVYFVAIEPFCILHVVFKINKALQGIFF